MIFQRLSKEASHSWWRFKKCLTWQFPESHIYHERNFTGISTSQSGDSRRRKTNSYLLGLSVFCHGKKFWRRFVFITFDTQNAFACEFYPLQIIIYFLPKNKIRNSILQDDIIDNGKRIEDAFIKHNATKEGGSLVTFSVYPGTAVYFAVVVSTTYPNANGSSMPFSSVYGKYGIVEINNLLSLKKYFVKSF